MPVPSYSTCLALNDIQNNCDGTNTLAGNQKYLHFGGNSMSSCEFGGYDVVKRATKRVPVLSRFPPRRAQNAPRTAVKGQTAPARGQEQRGESMDASESCRLVVLPLLLLCTGFVFGEDGHGH